MGTVLLVGSVVTAVLGAGAARDSLGWSRRLLALSTASLWLAFGLVVRALVRNDTSYRIVVDHGGSELSTSRRIAALWVGSSGSFLLFAVIVATVVTLTPMLKHQRAAAGTLVAVLAAGSFGLDSPFHAASDGTGDGAAGVVATDGIWTLVHAPLLYLALALVLAAGLAHPIPVPEIRAAAIIAVLAATSIGVASEVAGSDRSPSWTWTVVTVSIGVVLAAGLLLPGRHRLVQIGVLAVAPIVFATTALTSSDESTIAAFRDGDLRATVLLPIAVGSGAFAGWMRRRFPTRATATASVEHGVVAAYATGALAIALSWLLS